MGLAEPNAAIDKKGVIERSDVFNDRLSSRMS